MKVIRELEAGDVVVMSREVIKEVMAGISIRM